jgi:hypothetical protein
LGHLFITSGWSSTRGSAATAAKAKIGMAAMMNAPTIHASQALGVQAARLIRTDPFQAGGPERGDGCTLRRCSNLCAAAGDIPNDTITVTPSRCSCVAAVAAASRLSTTSVTNPALVNASGRIVFGEAAMLAGLVGAPPQLAPTRNLGGAKERADTVLQAMVETGAITTQQADAARALRFGLHERETEPVAEFVTAWLSCRTCLGRLPSTT